MNKKKPIIITIIVVIVCVIASIFIANKYINQKPLEITTQTQNVSNQAKLNTTTYNSTTKLTTITDTTIKETTTFIKKTTSTTKSKTEATSITTSKASTQTTSTTKKSPKATTTKTTTALTTSIELTQNSTVAPTTSNDSEICYVTVECKEILGKINKLSPGHSKYVPKNGYILYNYPVKYSVNDTAYDALKTACSDNNIKLTATSTIYGIYVCGINNIDEKDCGSQSGWLYSVNSVYPSVSCGKQEINPNDNIIFHYTCN